MLKVSALKTEVKLIKKWRDKKVIKKSPESAIATFFAIEDFNTVEFQGFKVLNWMGFWEALLARYSIVKSGYWGIVLE